MSELHDPSGGDATFPEPLTMPETIPELTDKDKIVDLATNLVDAHGQDDKSGDLRTAIFYVPDNETGDAKYPSLKVNVPKEEVANKYQWRAELTFGNQDARLSSHILVRKDGQLMISDHVDGKDKPLSDEQAKSFLAYMEQIQGNLIKDN